ncbi:hypothetical protein MKK55_26705 [Methylobacterium sp. J-059]|uniref:hypothetical protein n=1 Tax=Methylobacterium sp. J-059 TaxID=2836643 RepID=UPI001FBBFDE6|nr:hypothetical protein [Methylobacterium sp. J-059]MCJ2042511.1 hypothetical protein [Methylobacterium sp. J-059]
MITLDPMSGNRDFFAGAGEMVTLMRAYDWTTTPLGKPEGWPSGLRTAVRLLLNSNGRFANLDLRRGTTSAVPLSPFVRLGKPEADCE